ncbi:MAG: GDSL-type esterase/lipase family protein, partial [Deltaproteobacteria bacterium]|nr:GDSL-type esterase/lipase family protein [Deltaproteobacteria bacterium]
MGWVKKRIIGKRRLSRPKGRLAVTGEIMEKEPRVIVMLGDSQMAYFDGWGRLDPQAMVINLGRGGDNTHCVRSRVPEACVLKPRIIFLQAGINDLLQRATAGDLARRHQEIWRIVATLAPEARLVVCSLLPVNSKKFVPKE